MLGMRRKQILPRLHCNCQNKYEPAKPGKNSKIYDVTSWGRIRPHP